MSGKGAKGKRESNSKPAAKSGKGKKPTVNKIPVYAHFTKKSVEFNACARALSETLSDTYGPGVTISQFEKLIAQYHTMDTAQRGLLYLEKDLLLEYDNYVKVRDARDAERRMFRGDVGIKDVTTGLDAAMSALGIPKKDEKDKEGGEEGA
jgi:hypothetical protein